MATPKFSSLRYEILLALGEREEAERTMTRLHAIADETGHIRWPLNRYDIHVEDTKALALSSVAKWFGPLATDDAFPEKRLKGEATPPLVARKDATAMRRAYAAEALAIFAARAKVPPAVKIPVSYPFYIAWMSKLRK